MKNTSLLLFTLIITIIFLSVIQVVVSNKLSTSGVYLSKIEKEIDQYRRENYLLTEKILNHTSLTNLKSQADKLGYLKNRDILVLDQDLKLAVKP